MKILVTGICGFVGSTLVNAWLDAGAGGHVFYGVDNLIRPGSEINRAALKARGVRINHGDIRNASDFETLPVVDFVIDAAANPSVLAGFDNLSSSRQLMEHNLQGTINLLEFCKRSRAGLILLSTSRVYSIRALAGIAVTEKNGTFTPTLDGTILPGFSREGIAEIFSTTPPLSLYGAGKLASELLALEYGKAFGFPVWINRCGVLAGAGQFGHAEQGIFSFWIHSWMGKRPLKYIGFGGSGAQVRDALHPIDLIPVLDQQMASSGEPAEQIFNLSGGLENSTSLAGLSAWCRDRLGAHEVGADTTPRRFDVPWMVLDCTHARAAWRWKPTRTLPMILDEIADFARRNPRWIDISQNR
jgi:CDP-paratose 2-epimerase